MKKMITLLVILLGSFSLGAYAQSQYQKGNIMVNAGVSVGTFGYGYGLYGSSSGFLPITVNVEYSIDELFAVGPYAGIYSRTYKYGGYKDRFTALSFGGRGTLHASYLLNEHLGLTINEEKLDLYATVIMGFESRSWNFDSAYEGDRFYNNDVSFDFGTIVGVRYLFNSSYSAFFEAGRGSFGIGTLGVSARF